MSKYKILPKISKSDYEISEELNVSKYKLTEESESGRRFSEAFLRPITS